MSGVSNSHDGLIKSKKKGRARSHRRERSNGVEAAPYRKDGTSERRWEQKNAVRRKTHQKRNTGKPILCIERSENNVCQKSNAGATGRGVEGRGGARVGAREKDWTIEAVLLFTGGNPAGAGALGLKPIKGANRQKDPTKRR